MNYHELANSLKFSAMIAEEMGGRINNVDLLRTAAEAIVNLFERAEESEARAEKAEREKDATVQFLTSIIRYGTNPCECCKADCIDAGSDDAEYVSQCGAFEWSSQKKEE